MKCPFLLLLVALPVPAVELAEQSHQIEYTSPAVTWDEALPLGNGTLGALVWGDGAPLNLSLDRTDLWDLRPVPEFADPDYNYETMRRWEREGRYDELKRLYEDPYGKRPAPTKIPAGRIELTFPDSPAFREAELTIAPPEARVWFQNGPRIRAWIHATEPVGLFTIEHAHEPNVKLRAPAFGGKVADKPREAIVVGELAHLGYPAPREVSGPDWAAYEQEGWGGFRFAVHVCWRRAEDRKWFGAFSIASSREGVDPAALAKQRAESALDRVDTLLASHEAWWRKYWNQARVSVPDKLIERQYYLDMYKFGAASRRGSPPITLQGPWTADDGKLPPWKGDYHHDLNTQLSYWPCYAGNRLEEGLAYLDWLWETRDRSRDWTRRFFGMPGRNVPMTADLEGKPMGGWRQYTMSATTSAWLAHHFYLHWKYSQDREFLRDRAYPYLREVSEFLEAVTRERDANGKRTLPLSSSPEIHDNKPNAWFPTITNYDLALIRWCFDATTEIAAELGLSDDAARWRQLDKELPPFALGDDGTLLVAEGHPLTESHRHFSHLMAIHPLGLIDPDHGEADKRIVDASLADLARLGTDYWCGYSFAWEASLAARAGDGKRAAKALRTFASAFVLRNSFHANGDQSGKGYSKFTYRPFTLEGNFAAAAGLHEMLLQSHTGVIEIFPAVPPDWRDISFERLRAQGAVWVSAERKDEQTVKVTLLSEKDATCRLRSPWSGRDLTVKLRGGEELALTSDRHESIAGSIQTDPNPSPGISTEN